MNVYFAEYEDKKCLAENHGDFVLLRFSMALKSPFIMKMKISNKPLVNVKG